MATYDYKCSKDHYREVVRPMEAKEEPVFCSECSEEMKRVFAAPPIMFNGKGFNSKRGQSKIPREGPADVPAGPFSFLYHAVQGL